MTEYFADIKLLHVICVALSGSLFAIRGGAMLAGSSWGQRKPVRFTSYAIDTALLVSAIGLVVTLRLNPLATPWLAAKLILLPLYIIFGSLALKRARSRKLRAWCFGVALLLFMQIVASARTHRPFAWPW